MTSVRALPTTTCRSSILAAAISLLPAACGSREVHQAPRFPGEPVWLNTSGRWLKGKVFKGARLSPDPTLIVVLHGDLLEPAPDRSYHYIFADRAAHQFDNVIAVGFTRPGYTDERWRRVARQLWILVGHSCGAAITADLIGTPPAEIIAQISGALSSPVPATFLRFARACESWRNNCSIEHR